MDDEERVVIFIKKDGPPVTDCVAPIYQWVKNIPSAKMYGTMSAPWEYGKHVTVLCDAKDVDAVRSFTCEWVLGTEVEEKLKLI